MEEKVNELQMQANVLTDEVANLKSELEASRILLDRKQEECDTFYRLYSNMKEENSRLTQVLDSVKKILEAFLTK